MRSKKPAASPGRRSGRPREVFLSRAEAEPAPIDRAIHGVAQSLDRHGIPVWTAPAKIRGAQDWHDEIGRALARCDWFVVALTRRSVKRPWVRRELLYALHETRYHGRIVPLLFQKCAVEELSWTLRSSMQIIDFTADAAQAGRDVLKIWGLHDTQ